MARERNYIGIMTTIVATIVTVLSVYQVIQGINDKTMFLFFCNCCSLIFLYKLSFQKNVLFHNPLIYTLLVVFVGVTLRGYYMVYNSNNFDVNRLFLLNRGIDTFLYPTFILLLGLMSFLIGYSVSSKQYKFKFLKLFYREYEWNEKRLHIMTFLFFIISIVGVVLFIKSLGITSLLTDISKKRFVKIEGENLKYAAMGYYRLMAGFIEPVLYVYLVYFIYYKKKVLSGAGLLLGLLFLSNLFFPFFTSSRSALFSIFINILVILSVTGKLKTQLIMFSLFGGLLIFNVMTLLRAANNSNTTSSSSDIGASFLDPIVFNRNLLDVSKNGHIINGTPEKLEYHYGSSLISLIYAPIPRVWWEEKPAVNVGKEVAQKIYGVSDQQNTGVPPGIVAEMFFNFGMVGVILGLFFMGIFVKRSYLYFNFHNINYNKNKVVLYVCIIVNITVVLFGGSFTQAILSFLQMYLPMYLLLKNISFQAKPHLNYAQTPALAPTV